MRSRDRGGLIQLLPLLMFLIFALFWGIWDIKQGLYVALIPSVIVGIMLLLRARKPGSEGRP